MTGVLAASVFIQNYPLTLSYSIPLISIDIKDRIVNYNNLKIYNLIISPVTN